MKLMKILTVNEACRILTEHGFSVSPAHLGAHLGAGLQQGVYPFGVAIQMKQWVYEIYDTLLYKWIDERSAEREEVSA